MGNIENIYFCNFLFNEVKVGFILPLLMYSTEVMLKLLYYIGFNHFEPRVYLMGSIVIALVCPSLNISETDHQFFLKFCTKLGFNKVEKVTRPEFKKILIL